MQRPDDRLPTLLFLLIITLIHTPKSFCQDRQYVDCGQGYRCGNANLTYPFYGGNRPDNCGYPGFLVTCPGNVPMISVSQISYRILDSPDTTAHTIRVARDDLFLTNCPTSLRDTTLNFSIFNYSNVQNVTLFYGCPPALPNPQLPLFDCTGNPNFNTNFFVLTSALSSANISGQCAANMTVPIDASAASNLVNAGVLRAALMGGFNLEYEANNTNCQRCAQSGGRCGYNTDTNSFVCYCADRAYDLVCNGTASGQNGNGNGGSGLGSAGVFGIVGAVLAGVGVGFLIFWCRQRRKRLVAEASQKFPTESKDLSNNLESKALTSEPSVPSVGFTKSIPSYPSSTTEFGKDTSSLGVPVFSYSELEEATDNFARSRELGDGGFGVVYYGILNDGRRVAVKRLYENNFKRVEQFINEVEILARIRHPNLVALFGCTSKRSRELLLVYEYIPNGTVADHLHGHRSKSGMLSWSVRLNIAIETADALAYLHESDIIHRDVKTNNILLDNDFHVKVADFGLSRLFPNDVTHVSTAPQGTPGYVDPEYYQCYQLTEKSDVYSFGVVLIEIISSLQAVDTNRHRHDINLANMAVNKIQNHTLHELVDPSLEFGTNSSVRRMTTMVAELAFRCLQQERDMRPSMKEVADALRGIQKEGLNTQKVEVLDILIDDGEHPKSKTSPPSPDSVVPDTWVSSSTPNSSG